MIGAVSAEEKRAITAHLQSHVAALASDAALYGPNLGHQLDPRNDDSDRISEFEADDMATEEFVRTPCNVTFWLEHQCGDQTEPLKVGTYSIWDVVHCNSVPHLLALVMDGNNAQIINAAKRLRELFLASEATAISERAAELMKGSA